MPTLTYFPVVENRDELMDLVSRAAWFLARFEIERIYLPIASSDLAQEPWRVAPGMDPAIAGNFDKLREKVYFVVVRSAADLAICMEHASIVLRWKKDALPDFVSPNQIKAWEEGKKVWQVDPAAVRMEGSFYIDVGLSLIQHKGAWEATNREKFRRLSERLGRFDRAYLMATGPSIANYRKFDYTNALSIVCNSVILDEELMDTVRPQILVFADPIFHFGPSEYAAAFRATLLESSRKHDYTICIPFKYYPLFVSAMPELAERTIGIPFVKDREFNFDLAKDFQLKTTANILTFLMVPLAATFTDEIGFLGCDGRPLKENTYFWKHNQNTQFNDKMANIREIHPGFFNIDYNDYYLEHCEVLERQLSEGEKLNIVFNCLSTSHIPALDTRSRKAPVENTAQESRREDNFPRLLVVCLTSFEGYSATSRIKEAFFGAWPDEKFRHVYVNEGARKQLVFTDKKGEKFSPDSGHDEVIEAVIDYRPEVIYYRAVDNKLVHEFAHQLALRQVAPFVVHLMDDWPARLERVNPKEFPFFDHTLRQMLASASHRLVIGEEMSSAFRARYGFDFIPIANAIDAATAPNKRARKQSLSGPFIIRYAGALADDMTFASVMEVAKAVESLSIEINVRMEIYTRHPWKERAESYLCEARSVSVMHQVPSKDYPALLEGADALLIAYNFDEASRIYIGYSIANKLPEYMISGTPILAFGPRDIATIKYLVENKCAQVISESEPGALKDGIRRLISSPSLQGQLSKTARELAAKHHDVRKVRATLHKLLVSAAKKQKLVIEGGSTHSLVGPFARNRLAHLDETSCIARLFSRVLSGSVMVDVGAHHGSAFRPFLDAGWRVLAFEPDEVNRGVLLDRLAKHKNAALVSLDERAVSNESRKGLSFYRSEQSTGISGLSAFHSTHSEAQRVDTVTLTEALADRDFPAVDFLKIDTEGHDLFVLKGFPWERFKPQVIECEFEDAKTVALGYNFHDLARFLVEKGYTVYVSEWHPVIRYGIRHDWNRLARYPCELTNNQAWGNLLAFRRGPDEKELISATLNVLKIKREPSPITPESDSTEKQIEVASTTASNVLDNAACVTPSRVHTIEPVRSESPSVLAEQFVISMNGLCGGENWHRPEKHPRWGSFCWTGPGTRSTLKLPISRNCDKLLIIAYYRSLTSDQLNELRIEIDGAVVPHRLDTASSPPTIVTHVPARVGHTAATEIALQVPRTISASNLLQSSSDNRRVGLGIISVSVMPIGSEAHIDPATKQANINSASPTQSLGLTERAYVRMNKPPRSGNWYPANTSDAWNAYCLNRSGTRSALKLAVRRDQEMLAVIAYYRPFTRRQMAGLRIEVDGVSLPYEVQTAVRPKCIVARVPARTGHAGHTEIAVVSPPARNSARSGDGLGVIWIAMIPTASQLLSDDLARYSKKKTQILSAIRQQAIDFPLPYFNGLAYLATYPDVADAICSGAMSSALEHYCRHGRGENRRFALASTMPPNPGMISEIFDGKAYLEAHPDAYDAVRSGVFSSALAHYIKHGRERGYAVTLRMDGQNSIGTAFDILHQEISAGINVLRNDLSAQIQTQTTKVNKRLETIEVTVSTNTLKSDLDAVRRELGRLEQTSREGVKRLDAQFHDLSRAQETRGKHLNTEIEMLKLSTHKIEEKLSDSTRADQLEQVQTDMLRNLKEVRSEISIALERERSLFDQVAAVKSDLAKAQERLEKVADEEDLQRAQQDTLREIAGVRSEIAAAVTREHSLLVQIDTLKSDLIDTRQKLSATAQADDLARLQQDALRHLEQVHREISSTAAIRDAREHSLSLQIEGLKTTLGRLQDGFSGSARAVDLEHFKRDALRELDGVRGDIDTALRSREAREQAVQEQLDLLRISLDEAQRRLATTSRSEELDRLKRNVAQDIEWVRSEIASFSSVENAREQALLAHIDALKSEVHSAKTHAELAETKVATARVELGTETRQIAGSISGLDDGLATAREQVSKLNEELQRVKDQAAGYGKRINHPSLGEMNAIGYQGHRRSLQRAVVDRLLMHWAPLLGLQTHDKELYYLAHRVCSIEAASAGRLAASVDDMLLRILVARSLPLREIGIMEIGTLFGTSIGVLHESLLPLFDRVHFTVIDPLDGYYGRGNRDILTGVPVSRAVFDQNLRRMGVPAGDVTLIQRLSTDPRALQQARRKRYDMLVIDGDHSTGGVRNDAEKFTALVRPGGYVVFDDYGNPAWPDVKRYVDAEVMPRKELKLIGAEWHTAVFQVNP